MKIGVVDGHIPYILVEGEGKKFRINFDGPGADSIRISVEEQ